MGLRSVDEISLDDVRAEAKEYRKLLKAGIDPYDFREDAKRKAQEDAKLDAEKNKTFRDWAEAWTVTNHVPGGWSDGRAKIIRDFFLSKHTYPEIGHRSIRQFDIREDNTGLKLVAAVLKPLWGKKHETGRQVRKFIEDILYFAMGHDGLPRGPNAADKKLLKPLLAQVSYVPTPIIETLATAASGLRVRLPKAIAVRFARVRSLRRSMPPNGQD
jgi:hypothetical protein